MKGKYIVIATLILAIVAVLIVCFFDDIRTVVLASSDEVVDTTTDDDTSSERGHIFMTYSTLKTNDYFFAYNCYEKAKEAVENGKYETIRDYVYATDFDHDALIKAKAAVAAGEVSSELEYMQNHEDAGKMAFLLYFDPMFAASWGCYIDQSGLSGEDTKILYAEQDLPVPQQPDAAIQRFLDNPEEWDEAIARIESYLWAQDAEASIDELDDYTSGMYAVMDGITDGIPAVIVANTQNAGGHFIIIVVNGVSLRFRLECGYQPIEIPNWTPQITIIPDNPKKYVKDPKDDPLNNPNAPESDAWAPDPTNYDNDTTVTPDPNPETTNPDHYDPPEPPTEEATTEAPGDNDGKTVDPDDDTGSDIDDKNGETEKNKDGKDAEVTAGDGEDHQNFNDVNKDPNQQNTTEEQFDDHTTYDPDLTAPE